MKATSFAARRSAAQIKYLPPMVWRGERALPAVGYVISKDESDWARYLVPRLIEVRERVRDVARYFGLDDVHDLILVRFEEEVAFDAESLGLLIPLAWNSSRRLTNAPDQFVLNESDVRDDQFELEILWCGLRVCLKSTSSTTLNKWRLWRTPQFAIHESVMLPQKLSVGSRSSEVKNDLKDVPKTTEAAVLFSDNKVFEDIEAVVRDRQQSRWRWPFSRNSKRTTRFSIFDPFLAFGLVLVGIAILLFFSSTTDVKLGLSYLLRLIGIFLICYFIGRILSQKQIVGDISDNTNDGAYAADAKGTRPGLLQRMKGWIYWNTPFGRGLKDRYAQRFHEVNELLRRGEVDEALKRALAVAEKEAGKIRNRKRDIYPTDLPERRAKLDFDVDVSGFFNPILGENVFADVVSEYYELAKKLSNAGDHRRAGFVYAKLLGSYQLAVDELETGKHFGEAARLALKVGLPPDRVIRLFYLAGELARALNLAARFDNFQTLAQVAKNKHVEFYKFVIESWTERLAATQQWMAALRASDDLAAMLAVAGKRTALHDRRLMWLTSALQDADGIDAELVAYGLLFGPWQDGDVGAGWYFTQIHQNASMQARLLDRVGEWFGIARDGDTQCINELLQRIRKLGDRKRLDQKNFWNFAAKPIVDPLLRHAIAGRAGSLSKSYRNDLKCVAEEARLCVVAEDVRRLKSVHSKKSTTDPVTFHVKQRDIGRADIKHAVSLDDGQIVLWREDRQLELMDSSGALKWATTLSAVGAIVQVGSSPFVIIIQDVVGDLQLKRLVLFHSRKRKFVDLGAVGLRAWHDVTSDGQWLVQIDNGIGAIDLPRLLSKDKHEIAFLWRAQLTDNLHVLGFFVQSGQATSWITLDSSEGMLGLLEHWTYHTKTNKIEVYNYAHSTGDCCPGYCNWVAPFELKNMDDRDRSPSDRWFNSSYTSAKDAVKNLRAQQADGQLWTPRLFSSDFNRVVVFRSSVLDSGGRSAETFELSEAWRKFDINLIVESGVHLELMARSTCQDKRTIFAIKGGGAVIVDFVNRNCRFI